MPKSREFVSDSSSESDSDVEPKKKKKRRHHEEKPKKQIEAKASSSKTTGKDGETMFEIAKMRFASVSEFRSKKYVNIREYYYDQDGNMKPGKKGIALNVESWQKLKGCIADIDDALEEL